MSSPSFTLADLVSQDTGEGAGVPGEFWVELMAAIDADGFEDREVIDELAAMERLTSAAAAAKARLTAELYGRRVARDEAAGLPVDRRGKGVGHEVALARRESPHAGREHLNLAIGLTDMPETMAALGRGEINEYAAQLMVRETADLTRADRATVDATLGPQLTGLGNRQIVAKVRRLAYELDTAQAEHRARLARARRRVTMRPLADGMCRVSGDLPAEDAISIMASLRAYADLARASGDDRARDQVIADEFTHRLTYPVCTDGARRVEIQLVMNAEMLLGVDQHTPVHLVGYGPIAYAIAADLLADEQVQVLVRRLFANPDDNSLVAMDRHGIRFTGTLRRLLFARDGETCRTPWCDAPAEHGDHVTPRAQGGQTTLDGGQGLCAACNYAKEAPGWTHTTLSTWPQRHTTQITTPTRHTHWSQAPPLPVTPSPPADGPRRVLKMELYRSNVQLIV